MQVHLTPLYPKRSRKSPKFAKLLVLALVLVLPATALGSKKPQPYQQDFLITAYYSPQSGQCCYVKGGETADKILNGQGHTAADGTSVYAGMIAAPPSYPFGTRIVLEGIGTFEVNDRGGAIQTLADGVDRLDVWAGFGEEGLARALALGLRDVKGTVYLPGSDQPKVAFSLDSLVAPIERLQDYLVRGRNLMAMDIQYGQKGLSVQMLQDELRTAGYFPRPSSGYFGSETLQALKQFFRDQNLRDDPKELTPVATAHIIAAANRVQAGNPVSGHVDSGSNAKQFKEAQRILRFLGYYTGRTDGTYNDGLYRAILSFQQDNRLVGDASSNGAGRIGPLTMKSLRKDWNDRLVSKRADRLLQFNEVSQKLEEMNKLPDRFMGVDATGSQVRLLQDLLVERGFFPKDKINGNFGPLTKSSLVKYQLDRGIITHALQNGAGYVGPSTLTMLREEEQKKYYRLVRSEGWKVL